MNKAFRITGHVCILLAITIFVGCSDDDPAAPAPAPSPTMGGSIGIYADAAGTDRTVPGNNGQVTVYVVHKVTDGAMASSFKVEAPAGWTLANALHMFPVNLGDVQNGISYGYGRCMAGTVHVATLTYVSPGYTANAMFKVSPHTGTPQSIEVVDCDDNLLRDAIGEQTPVLQP